MTKAEYRRRLAGRSVGIAGAGGLGSNCAAALARAGVGRLVIADFDSVSRDNLDRQFFFLDQVGLPKVEALAANLARVDPAVEVVARNVRLDADLAVELFRGCDLVVEAFDSAEAKAMLIEAVLSRLPGLPLVTASGLAGYGGSNEMRERRSGSLYLVGDLRSEVGPESPPMAPRVLIAAAMEANAALEILLGEGA
ncbi:MAG TPA: sulfur carrier protein ThiS adenylyltransferase ThiF [Spirochaetales bacterium]|nr:sulfur carrier protein ThiS adenylyltransferase ThiF [Spirochaetales bacterium]